MYIKVHSHSFCKVGLPGHVGLTYLKVCMANISHRTATAMGLYIGIAIRKISHTMYRHNVKRWHTKIYSGSNFICDNRMITISKYTISRPTPPPHIMVSARPAAKSSKSIFFCNDRKIQSSFFFFPLSHLFFFAPQSNQI